MHRVVIKVHFTGVLVSLACAHDDHRDGGDAVEAADEEEVEASEAATLRAPADEPDAATRDVYPDFVLETPYGGELAFFYDPVDLGVTMIETGRVGDPTVLRDPSLIGASALEVYWNLTETDEEVPGFLVTNHELVADKVTFRNATPQVSRGGILTADLPPDAAYSECNANSCWLLGWDEVDCEFNVAANQERHYLQTSNDESGTPHMWASACHLGTASVTVTLRYRTDTTELCGAPTGSYTNFHTGGFPTIDDHEYAQTSYSGTAWRHWYMDKETTTNGTTDLELKTQLACPEG
ncbi:MAG TPA: hypothetical protein VG755_00005 [Nannocystaceae bacterium]|nr:hypothetical protein [Nannocystaceae bacterium]